MRWSIALCVVGISGIAAADPISLRVADPTTQEVDAFRFTSDRPVTDPKPAPAWGLAKPPGFNDRWAAFEPRMPWRSVWAGVDVDATVQLAVTGMLGERPARYAMVVPVSALLIYGVHRLAADR